VSKAAGQSKGKYVPFYRRPAVMVVALTVAVVIVAVDKGLGLHQEAKLQKRLRTYRDRKEPVTAAQIPGWIPSLAPEDNAAERFRNELHKRKKYLSAPRTAAETAGLPFLDQMHSMTSWNEDICRRSRAYLLENESWLATLHNMRACQGLSVATFRNSRIYADIRQPYVTVITHGISCLCLEALVLTCGGQTDTAIESLSTATALASQLLAEPFLVNIVTATSEQRKILRTATIIAANSKLSETNVVDARALCVLVVDVDAIRAALLLERLAGLDYYYFRDATPAEDERFALSYLSTLPKFVACGRVLEYLDYIDACVAVFDLPQGQQWATAKNLELYGRQLQLNGNALLSLGPPISALTRAQLHCSAMARLLDQILLGNAPRQEDTVTIALTGDHQ